MRPGTFGHSFDPRDGLIAMGHRNSSAAPLRNLGPAEDREQVVGVACCERAQV